MRLKVLVEQPFGVETVRGTVLFADLRGYTTLAERLDPAAVVALLDQFFTVLGQAVEDHEGAVFHLAGDSLMAGFGLADSGTAPVRRAIGASRAMVAAFAPVATSWAHQFGISTGIGVGVHVGPVAYAALGPASMRRATLIGDTVNVAARLCQRARAGEVLFSAGVAAALDRAAETDIVRLPSYTLRGRETPIEICCVPARERVVVEADAAKVAPQTVAAP
jgi:adenylate cyclase